MPKPNLTKQGVCLLLMAAILPGGIPSPAWAQNTTPPDDVVKLPDTPPPTGLLAPLPKPALPIPKPDKPTYVSPQIAAAMKPLTINEAVAVALAVNRSLAIANANLLRAQGRSEEARTAFIPTLNSTLSYLRLNQGNSFDIGGQRVTIVNESQRQIGVQATLPLDISGLLRAATDQAKFLEIAARLDVNRTRNQIVQDVKSGFYDVLRSQALVVVATENLQNSLARLKDSQVRLAAGTVAKFDVLRAQTDVANGQQQLIQARNQVSLSIAALNNTIGINVNTPLKLSREGAVETPPGYEANPTPGVNPMPPGGPNANAELIRSAEALLQDTPQNPPLPTQRPSLNLDSVTYDSLQLGPDYDKILQEALATRPEVWQAEANIVASKKGIQLARRSVLPGFSLNWGLNYAPDTAGFTPVITTWQATAAVSLPLFDGGLARARVRQARADVASNEVNRRQTDDLVTLEVRQAYLNLVQARDRVIVSSQSLIQAEESFRLARVRYTAGVTGQNAVSPLLEVSDAQTALAQAQVNEVNALYDYNTARVRLDRAIGRYSYVSDGPGYSAPPTAKQLGVKPFKEGQK